MQREVIGKEYDIDIYEPYLRAAAIRREERAGRVGRGSTTKTKEKSYVEARMRLENTPIEYLQVLDSLVRGADFEKHINLEDVGSTDTIEERAEYFDAIIDDRNSWRLRNPLFDSKAVMQYADEKVGLTIPEAPRKSDPVRLNPFSRVMLNRNLSHDYERGSRSARMAREEKSTRLLEARIRAARSSNDMTRLISDLVEESRDTRAIAKLSERMESMEKKIVGLRTKADSGIELTKKEKKNLEKYEEAFTDTRVDLNARTAEMAKSLDERMEALRKQSEGTVYTLEDYAARRDALQELDFLQQKRDEVMEMRKTSYELYREKVGESWTNPTARYVPAKEIDGELEKETETETETETEKETEKETETEVEKETETEVEKDTQEEPEKIPKEAAEPKEKTAEPVIVTAQARPDEVYRRNVPPEKLRSAKNYAPGRQQPGAARQKTKVLGEQNRSPVARERQAPVG